MKKNNLKIFCVTNKKLNFLENSKYQLVGVGGGKFNKNYIKPNKKKNIYHKEKYYSELTFHYWFWKNELKKYNEKIWIGFCQKRRFWLSNNSKKKITSTNQLLKNLLYKEPKSWKNYDSVICKPIDLSNPKKMKIIKRGWKNIIDNPKILFKKNSGNIELHFDMHHGYKVLEKAIDIMHVKDKLDFKKFVVTNTKFNPHIMFIARKKVMNRWFNDLFKWLFDCEKIFGFKKLKGYDQKRLYAFLAERFLSFWFKKYTKSIEWQWTFFEKN